MSCAPKEKQDLMGDSGESENESYSLSDNEFRGVELCLQYMLGELDKMTPWAKVVMELWKQEGLADIEKGLTLVFGELGKIVRAIQQSIKDSNIARAQRQVNWLIKHAGNSILKEKKYRGMVLKTNSANQIEVEKQLDTIRGLMKSIKEMAEQIQEELRHIEDLYDDSRDSPEPPMRNDNPEMEFDDDFGASDDQIARENSSNSRPTSSKKRSAPADQATDESEARSPKTSRPVEEEQPGSSRGGLVYSPDSSQPSTSANPPSSFRCKSNKKLPAASKNRNGTGSNGTVQHAICPQRKAAAKGGERIREQLLPSSSKASEEKKGNGEKKSKPQGGSSVPPSIGKGRNTKAIQDEKEAEDYRQARETKRSKWGERDERVANQFTDQTTLREKASQLIPGGDLFMPIWSIVEKTYLPIRNNKIFRSSTAEGFKLNLEEHGLAVVHLVSNPKEVLGLQCPDINFGNIEDFLETDVYKWIMDSAGNQLFETLGAFERQMKLRGEGQPYIPLNIVSQEESQNKKIKIVLPNVVMERSVTEIIKKVAKKMIRDYAEEDKKRIRKGVKNLMAVDKYVILSMKDSFMDVHIDLSATAVYYFVWRGKKIFYAAPPTKNNMKLYEELETKRCDNAYEEWMSDETWIANKLDGDIQRVEIQAGHLALLPAGWLHFVFTPEDSVVFGGNFLTTDDLPLVFRATKLEEQCVEAGRLTAANLFRNLYETLFLYVECMQFDKNEEELRKIAGPLGDELKHHIHDTENAWYTPEKRQELLEKLEKYSR